MSLAQAVELHRQGRRAEAQMLYERALTASPHGPQCRFLLGLCLLEQGKIAEGEACMRQVLVAVPRIAEEIEAAVTQGRTAMTPLFSCR